MTITIAIDCMGGDHGPRVTVPAALAAARQHPDLSVIPLARRPAPSLLVSDEGGRIVVRHASEVVGMDELCAAMRNKKDSSMRVAINLSSPAKPMPASRRATPAR